MKRWHLRLWGLFAAGFGVGVTAVVCTTGLLFLLMVAAAKTPILAQSPSPCLGKQLGWVEYAHVADERGALAVLAAAFRAGCSSRVRVDHRVTLKL